MSLISAKIIVKEDINNIMQLFVAEETDFKNQRASYEVKKKKDEVVFEIKAKDSSALRAVINSITKIITVYEKTKKAVHEKR